MGGRQAHGNMPSKAPKAKTKKNRALNAFAIAAQENPERMKVKRHRLGDLEGADRPKKRGRAEEDGEEEEEDDESQKKKRKAAPKGRFDELDIDEGSDSEGNEWKMGQVDSDDDSDLDSDDAFGESDEEKYEGFTFSGNTQKSKKPAKKRAGNMNLDEEEQSEDESDDDSLGEDAIDLAAMLDATEGNSEDEAEKPDNEDEDEESNEENSGEDESEDESMSSFSDDDDNDPDKLAALQNLVANLPQADLTSQAQVTQRHDGASEYATPSNFGVTSKTKLTLQDLGLPSVSDPHVKKSLKLLAAEAKGDSGKNGISGKLAVPLARRQQDALDRSAAYEKTKETLDRWTDTVKHNRRAEHLVFPLPDADHASMTANTRLMPTTTSKPFNDLEATIQSILEESGLATADGKDDEDKIREFEELKTNKMSLEEVKARRDQLRMARELMFREEVRSKRIKKIKSKSYRRVHRKEREKEERLNKEALLEAGIMPSEDEIEAQDRRRAEERMGSKHRGSKWAKATKETGRAAWDEDARQGITEMARRDEELRKRVEGRSVRREEADDDSFSDSEDYGSDEEDGDEKTLRRLEALKNPESGGSGTGTRLSNMKFMLKADAQRKKENDSMVEQMRRELAGEDSQSEGEQDDVGRRAFGPGSKKTTEESSGKTNRNEFEEPGGSDISDVEQTSKPGEEQPAAATKKTTKSQQSKPSFSGIQFEGFDSVTATKLTSTITTVDHEGGAWSQAPIRKDPSSERRRKANQRSNVEELDITNAAMIAAPLSKPKKEKTAKPKKNSTVLLDAGSEDEPDSDAGPNLPFAIKDTALIARAFAGADVVGEFEKEKRQMIEEEEEKVVDNTLPGWGSWTGDGVSKREKAKNKGRFLTKTAGIKEENRKDKKLDKVIINEKRVKKVCLLLSLSLFIWRNIANARRHRMSNTSPTPSLIHSRRRRSMSALFDFLLVLNGRPRRHSRMRRSRGFCSSRALLRRCQSRCCRVVNYLLLSWHMVARSFAFLRSMQFMGGVLGTAPK
jgi:U3 small nucleolar RNA-associated protein 14